MNCPICEKAGLEENTISCPQCDSDLTGFLLIKTVATNQQKLTQEKILLDKKISKSKTTKNSVLVVCALIILVLLFSSLWLYSSNQSEVEQIISSNKVQKDSLQNLLLDKEQTIATLKSEANKTQPITTELGTDDFKYVVRKNDNLIKISRFFYNSDNQYQKIMKDNNLTEGYTLFAGDTLIIKLKN